MKIAIINNNIGVSADNKISDNIYESFCGRYVPYKINNTNNLQNGKHVGVFILDEKNPELISKIIKFIENESRKNMG
jgi:hypothetical protein